MDCGLQRRPYPERDYAAQPRVARPSRATLGRRTTDDSNPERLVQNGPPVWANEGSHDIANGSREFTFYRTPTGFAREYRRIPRVARRSSGNPGLRCTMLSA